MVMPLCFELSYQFSVDIVRWRSIAIGHLRMPRLKIDAGNYECEAGAETRFPNSNQTPGL